MLHLNKLPDIKIQILFVVVHLGEVVVDITLFVGAHLVPQNIPRGSRLLVRLDSHVKVHKKVSRTLAGRHLQDERPSATKFRKVLFKRLRDVLRVLHKSSVVGDE